MQFNQTPEWLKKVPLALMETLIESPHLFVLPSEVSVYVLLKQFLVFHPDWKGDATNAVLMSTMFFKVKSLDSNYPNTGLPKSGFF